MSFVYALKGMWLLAREEAHVQIQLCITFLVIILGFLLRVSLLEWALVLFCCALVLVTEALNTAIEKTLDFVHPAREPKIGIIKDISAGAVLFAAVFSVIIGLLIFLPKIIKVIGSF